MGRVAAGIDLGLRWVTGLQEGISRWARLCLRSDFRCLVSEGEHGKLL